MLLSTLAGYVKAMGGELKRMVEFPDRPAVRIANLGDVQEKSQAAAGSRGRGKNSARMVPG